MHCASQCYPYQATNSIGISLVVALLFVTSCSREPNPNALARIEGKEITIKDLTEQLQRQQAGSPVAVDQRKLFDEMVAREVMVQSAIKAGLETSPEVQEALQNALISALKEKNLAPKLSAIQVSDEEIKISYENQREKYTNPERTRLAVLFAETKGDSATEARQRLEAALLRAKNENAKMPLEQGFGPLAMDYSDDQETRYKGGDLGWVDRARFPQRLEQTVIDTGSKLQQLGDTSEVIIGKKGLYVIKLLGKEAASLIPIEKVAANIRQQLLLEKRNRVEGDFQRTIRDSLRIEIHPERLSAIHSASPSKDLAPPTFR